MTAMKRSGRTGSAIVPAVLCTLLAAVPAVAAPGAGQTATPPTWGSCDRFISDTYLPAAQCTTVPVPIDDADPAGPQAQLAVVKIPASGERLGVLLMNLCVPLIDMGTQPPVFGHKDKQKGGTP